MDLPYILKDFEEYFEMKFEKKPVLVRKNANFAEEDPSRQNNKKPPVAATKLPQIGSASSKNLPDSRGSKSDVQTERKGVVGKVNKSLPPSKDDFTIEIPGTHIDSKQKN